MRLAEVIDKSQAEQLSRNWWIVLLSGLISITAGIIILSIDWTPLNLAYFIGALLIIRGIGLVFSPASAVRSATWNAFVGVLSILVGLAIIFAPTTLPLFGLFLGVWFVISGLVDITASFANRDVFTYWWLVLTRGLLVVTLGFFALFRPLLTLLALVVILAVWALVVGISEVVLSAEVRRLPEIREKAIKKMGMAA